MGNHFSVLTHPTESAIGVESAMLLTLLFQLLAFATSTPVSDRDDAGPVPVVLWHGMGDSAGIMIGGNLLTDTESGFFRDTNRQIREVCEMIAEDAELAGGYNAIGFSQGGQFLRAVAQRCPS